MSRMISRQEAALMLDMTPQSVSNWIDKGLLKGHYVEGKQVMVDRHSIEVYFDKLSDLAFMEKRIDAMKAELTQLEASLQVKIKDMRKSDALFDEGNSPRVITATLQALYNVAGEELLSWREREILKDLFEGKSLYDVSREHYMSYSGMANLCVRSIAKIRELKKYPSLYKEYKELKAENQTLRLYVETLDRILATFQNKVDSEIPVTEPNDEDAEELSHLKELLSTRIRDLDINMRTFNCLRAAGAETLADVVRMSKNDLLRHRNFGKKGLTQLEDYIESLGLTFGMDVDTIIADDIRKWRLQKEKMKQETL